MKIEPGVTSFRFRFDYLQLKDIHLLLINNLLISKIGVTILTNMSYSEANTRNARSKCKHG